MRKSDSLRIKAHWTRGHFFSCAWIALLTATLCHAHPVHTASAEVDYNRQTRSLEVCLRVFTSDLETALIRRTEREITVEKTPAAQLDALILEYLGTCFTVKSATGTVEPLKWVGREFDKAGDDASLLLYIEVPLHGGLDGLRLWNGLLCDVFKDQQNTAQVRDGDRKVTLGFNTDHGEQAVQFAPKPRTGS